MYLDMPQWPLHGPLHAHKHTILTAACFYSFRYSLDTTEGHSLTNKCVTYEYVVSVDHRKTGQIKVMIPLTALAR